jgi:hypothetical protein
MEDYYSFDQQGAAAPRSAAAASYIRPVRSLHGMDIWGPYAGCGEVSLDA